MCLNHAAAYPNAKPSRSAHSVEQQARFTRFNTSFTLVRLHSCSVFEVTFEGHYYISHGYLMMNDGQWWDTQTLQSVERWHVCGGCEMALPLIICVRYGPPPYVRKEVDKHWWESFHCTELRRPLSHLNSSLTMILEGRLLPHFQLNFRKGTRLPQIKHLSEKN